MRKSEDEDNYADWMFAFDEQSTTGAGFAEDEKLDQEILDELYDENLSVEEAVREYHNRK